MQTADLPNNLKQHPRLGQWLRFEGNKAEIFPGKVEIGQGIVTALVQIACEELGLSLEQVVARPASTAHSPNETVTSGSLSIQECGFAIRHVCTIARTMLIASARQRFPEQWDQHQGEYRIDRGRVCLPNGTELGTYWDEPLVSALGKHSCLADAVEPVSREVTQKSLPRLDFPSKFTGRAAFIQDMRLPEMRFSLIVRGVAQEAQLASIRKALEAARVRKQNDSLPELLVDGRFAALTCPSILELARYQKLADQAIARALLVTSDPFNNQKVSNDWLVHAASERTEVLRKGHRFDAADLVTSPNPPGVTATVFEASFDKPWLSHASIGLSCAVACYRPGESIQVWTHSQGIFNLRSDLFLALGERCALSETQFVVQHVEGAGCYGHNGADDVAFDAARVALSCPGVPVRVQWTRAQELGCAPFSPAMRVRVQASLSADSPPRVKSWAHTVWSNGHSLRPGRAPTPTLLGSAEVAGGPPMRVSVNAAPAMGYGSERNAQPLYAFEELLVENHRLTEMPIRSSAFRGLGAIANVFAIESMMDEMARHLHEDPLEFRLRHLPGDEHLRARCFASGGERFIMERSPQQKQGVSRPPSFERNNGLRPGVCALQKHRCLVRSGRRDRTG
jgi:CO/xanthine dehydrogenase Mo-binding subunit